MPRKGVALLVILIMMVFGYGKTWAIRDFEINLQQDPVATLPDGVTQISYPSNGVSYKDSQHGWQWYAIEFQVEGAVKISLGGCQYTNYEGYVLVGNETDTSLRPIPNKTAGCWESKNPTNNVGTYIYAGEAATLRVYCGQYCPYVKVESYNAVNNATALKAALAAADGTSDKPCEILLMNATYDLGTDVNTLVKQYTTLVGESRDGVIITNAPATEGLGTTATLKTESNVQLKNLTVKCRAPYSAEGAERGVCLWDSGTGNTYENICLDGLQDTYYSTGDAGKTSTFTDCIIRGTVDFICGSGNVTFNNCTLQLATPHNGGSPIIAAPATFTKETPGFVFNGCTIEAVPSSYEVGCEGHSALVSVDNFYLARGWYAGNDGTDRTPKVAFKNVTFNGVTPNANRWSTSIGNAPAEDRSIFYFTEKVETTTPERTAKWDWQRDYPSTLATTSVGIEKKTAYIPSGIEGVELFVDALTNYSVDGSKLNYRRPTNPEKDDAQCNKGTIIRVPIRHAGDIVTFVPRKGTYTVGGIETTGKYEYTATAADAQTGYVEIKTIVSGYLYSITVKQIEFSNSSFEDFKIDFRTDPYTVLLPETKKLPDGVKVSYTKFNGAQHGVADGTIVMPVDGPVKITVGGCSYGDRVADVKDKNDTVLATLPTKAAGCDGGFGSYNNNATWVYTGKEANTLTIALASYCPYFFAEAVSDCKITYYNTDGTTELFTETVTVGTPLAFSETAQKLVTIDDGYLFRGWFDADSKQVTEGTELVGNLKLYAKQMPENVTVTYYDTDGTTVLESSTVANGTALTFSAEAQGKVTVLDGYKFRGWFENATDEALKIKAGQALVDHINLYAKATMIETTTTRMTYTYDLTKPYFYQEDHELLTMTGGAYYNNHGWLFNNGRVEIQVSGNTYLTLGLCKYSSGTIQVKAEGVNIGDPISLPVTNDGETVTVKYEGPATTLSFDISTYLHSIVVKDADIPVINFVNRYPATLLGTVPDPMEADNNNEVLIPENQLLYLEGWTVTGWTDGEKTYPLKETAVINKSTTLYPVIAKNTQELSDNNTDGLKAVWYFDLQDGAPLIDNLSKKTMTYTKCIEVNGEKHDVPLYIDATNGKATNSDAGVNALPGGKGGQLNKNTILYVPAVYGMKVTVNASNKMDNRDKYAGNETYFGTGDGKDAKIKICEGTTELDLEGTVSNNNKSITFEYKGDATSIGIKVEKAGSIAPFGFFTDLTVIYPVLPDVRGENFIQTTPLYANEKHENAGTITVIRQASEVSHDNIGSRFKAGDKVTIAAEAGYGYEVTGFKVKDGEALTMTTSEVTFPDGTVKNVPNAAFTVPADVVITTIEVLYNRQTMHKVTVTTDKDSNGKLLGEVSLSPRYSNFYNQLENGSVEAYYTPNTSVTATAEAKTEYVVDRWTDGKEEGETTLSVANAYQFTVDAEKTLKAYFKPGEEGNVKFSLEGVMVNGATAAYNNATSMDPMDYTKVRSFTIPTNYTIFKNVDDEGNATEDGNTLRYWKDEDGNQYDLGKVYFFKEKNTTLTLTPYYERNQVTQINRLNNPVLRYDFGKGVRTYDDPTSGERRKVCAQEVNIGKNQKVFWTSQVYVKVLDNGTEYLHWRDVALWVDTGSKGYVRNGDLPEWAAFGPGTTFWIASCAGTKFSLLTYAPITTTTIDGNVPTLDTEDPRCKPEEHQYVYSYTTNNTADRIALVIGDDYSYYQWIEAATLAANMVKLTGAVDDEVRGGITEIKSTSNYEAEKQEDGSYAFHKGNRVRMTFRRNFGFEFDKIIDPDKLVNGEPLAVLKKNADGTVDMVKPDNAYDVQVVQKNADGTWGTEDGDDATVFTLKETSTEDNRMKYEVEFNITTHRNLVVCFKEKPTYYITYNAGQLAEGSPPAAQWVEAGDEYTIPLNTTLYYEGYTLKYWLEDAENPSGTHYIPGTPYKAPAGHKRLFPVFEPNTFNILDIKAATKATWHFTRKDGAPTMAYENSAGILMTQLYKDETKKDWIDLKIYLDATQKPGGYGKFNNVSDIHRMQVRDFSVIQFPATSACVVGVTATGTDVYGTTVAGKKQGDDGYVAENNSIAVTCPDQINATDSVVFTKNCYCVDFTVTYKPQTATKPTLTALTIGDTSLTAEQLTALKESANKTHKVDLPPTTADKDVDMPKVTGVANNGGTVAVTPATIAIPYSTVTVSTAGGIIVETYTISYNFTAPSDFTDNRPLIKSIKVNGNVCEKNKSGEERTQLSNQPVSGVITIEFSRTMKATRLNVKDIFGIETDTVLTAKQGTTLTFKYWDLPTDKTLNVNFPADTFTDIYGVKCQETIEFAMTSSATTMPIQHRTFDFVVGRDGSIDDAINKANADKGSDRYYIFVPDGEYQLTGNEPLNEVKKSDNVQIADREGNIRPGTEVHGMNNGRTQITRANVSLIGQSQKGVVIYNDPIVEGISYTPTIHLSGWAKDFYAEDMTLENRFPYWLSMEGQTGAVGAGRAVVFRDQGNRSIMKNVELWSWQDTYYSANASADYRGYFENCTLAGVVDWLCGNGDIWLQKCDIVIRDRAWNNIAAPSTETSQQWGYVFNQCNIMPEPGVKLEKLADGNWTLARPWTNPDDTRSPACTFLNTKMSIKPRDSGWGSMGSGKKLRFHEYETMDGNGNLLSLGARSLVASNPAAGSDDCILTAAQAAEYTIRAVMGGTDSFDPKSLTMQIDAKSATEGTDLDNHMIWDDQIELDDDRLQWKTEPMALCYFVFKKNEATGKWEYRANVAQQSDDETVTGLSLERYGSGTYMVRAANQRGGLGAATQEIEYVEQDKYTLTITQTEGQPVDYGWATICLPYNAKNPAPESLTLYAGTAVADYVMTLQKVDIINKNRGYVVYGKVGDYEFKSTSHTNNTETILEGNPSSESIDKGNNNCYVLANKPSTYGIGFYRYAGTMLAANKAWLPISKVGGDSEQSLQRAVLFRIKPGGITDIVAPHLYGTSFPSRIYDLNGVPVKTPIKGNIYIVDGQQRLW